MEKEIHLSLNPNSHASLQPAIIGKFVGLAGDEENQSPLVRRKTAATKYGRKRNHKTKENNEK